MRVAIGADAMDHRSLELPEEGFLLPPGVLKRLEQEKAPETIARPFYSAKELPNAPPASGVRLEQLAGRMELRRAADAVASGALNARGIGWPKKRKDGRATLHRAAKGAMVDEFSRLLWPEAIKELKGLETGYGDEEKGKADENVEFPAEQVERVRELVDLSRVRNQKQIESVRSNFKRRSLPAPREFTSDRRKFVRDRARKAFRAGSLFARMADPFASLHVPEGVEEEEEEDKERFLEGDEEFFEDGDGEGEEDDVLEEVVGWGVRPTSARKRLDASVRRARMQEAEMIELMRVRVGGRDVNLGVEESAAIRREQVASGGGLPPMWIKSKLRDMRRPEERAAVRKLIAREEHEEEVTLEMGKSSVEKLLEDDADVEKKKMEQEMMTAEEIQARKEEIAALHRKLRESRRRKDSLMARSTKKTTRADRQPPVVVLALATIESRTTHILEESSSLDLALGHEVFEEIHARVTPAFPKKRVKSPKETSKPISPARLEELQMQAETDLGLDSKEPVQESEEEDKIISNIVLSRIEADAEESRADGLIRRPQRLVRLRGEWGMEMEGFVDEFLVRVDNFEKDTARKLRGWAEKELSEVWRRGVLKRVGGLEEMTKKVWGMEAATRLQTTRGRRIAVCDALLNQGADQGAREARKLLWHTVVDVEQNLSRVIVTGAEVRVRAKIGGMVGDTIGKADLSHGMQHVFGMLDMETIVEIVVSFAAAIEDMLAKIGATSVSRRATALRVNTLGRFPEGLDAREEAWLRKITTSSLSRAMLLACLARSIHSHFYPPASPDNNSTPTSQPPSKILDPHLQQALSRLESIVSRAPGLHDSLTSSASTPTLPHTPVRHKHSSTSLKPLQKRRKPRPKKWSPPKTLKTATLSLPQSLLPSSSIESHSFPIATAPSTKHPSTSSSSKKSHLTLNPTRPEHQPAILRKSIGLVLRAKEAAAKRDALAEEAERLADQMELTRRISGTTAASHALQKARPNGDFAANHGDARVLFAGEKVGNWRQAIKDHQETEKDRRLIHAEWLHHV